MRMEWDAVVRRVGRRCRLERRYGAADAAGVRPKDEGQWRAMEGRRRGEWTDVHAPVGAHLGARSFLGNARRARVRSYTMAGLWVRLGAFARTSQRRVSPRRSAPGREGFLGNACRARVRSYAMAGLRVRLGAFARTSQRRVSPRRSMLVRTLAALRSVGRYC
ncbi:hypothetical protein XFF6992_20008 [Xanthomonas citri pv. fuscans]|nr:hypothetical protein XFF6992_20008 [Xanthomonas citri pv. fuscans]SOO32588.1 hypothetical protein XFF6994_20005 [Xanthomonas citri pv. fuscans]